MAKESKEWGLWASERFPTTIKTQRRVAQLTGLGGTRDAATEICFGHLKAKHPCGCDGKQYHLPTRPCYIHIARLLRGHEQCSGGHKNCNGVHQISEDDVAQLVIEWCTSRDEDGAEGEQSQGPALRWHSACSEEEIEQPGTRLTWDYSTEHKEASAAAALVRCIECSPAVTSTRAARSGGRAIDYVLARECSSENPYLVEFANAAWLPQLQNEPRFNRLVSGNEKNLAKEITESFAVRRLLNDYLEIRGMDENSSVLVIDLCSGRGITASLLALEYPNSHIHMVDVDELVKLEHVAALPNLFFHRHNAHATDLPHQIQGLDAATKSACTVLIGTHLCGMLSPRLIELYEGVEAVEAMIVSPCCLKGALGNRVKDQARLGGREQYAVLCEALLAMVHTFAHKEIHVDENVRSPKNGFLFAHKVKLNQP